MGLCAVRPRVRFGVWGHGWGHTSRKGHARAHTVSVQRRAGLLCVFLRVSEREGGQVPRRSVHRGARRSTSRIFRLGPSSTMICWMPAWSDRRVRWAALAAAGLYALGPLFLLADGGTETWMLLITLAMTPLIVVLLPIWFSHTKRKRDDQDRLRIMVEVTAWPSLIAMYIAFVIMGIAAGLKIAGTTGAVVGALVVLIWRSPSSALSAPYA